MTFPAMVPVTLHTHTVSGVDELGAAILSYTAVELVAYWLETQATEPKDATTTDRYIEKATLGVPQGWPAVTAADRITVAGRVWAVDGQPVDYSLSPFADLWTATTGQQPGLAINLVREVD